MLLSFQFDEIFKFQKSSKSQKTKHSWKFVYILAKQCKWSFNLTRFSLTKKIRNSTFEIFLWKVYMNSLKLLPSGSSLTRLALGSSAIFDDYQIEKENSAKWKLSKVCFVFGIESRYQHSLLRKGCSVERTTNSKALFDKFY